VIRTAALFPYGATFQMLRQQRSPNVLTTAASNTPSSIALQETGEKVEAR